MATVETTKKYFVHNIYGDEQSLLDSIPSDVVTIPAGWSDAAETNRNDYISAMNTKNTETGAWPVNCSCYPTIFYYRNEFSETITVEQQYVSATPTLIITGEDSSQSVTYTKVRKAGFYEMRVALVLPDKNDWTWANINSKIQWLIDNNKIKYDV